MNFWHHMPGPADGMETAEVYRLSMTDRGPTL